MKLIKFLLFTFILSNNFYSQDFKVVFLIDKPYEKTTLNTTLESMNGLSLIGEDFVQFKMTSNSENEVKLPHDNGLEGKDKKKSNVIGMAGVRCNPCKRLLEERKTRNTTYVLTSDNDFGTCKLNVDDYETLASGDDLEDIIKKERKKAKKLNEAYKVIFWIPSNQTISVDLVADNENKKVDFGTLVTFTASTNSKESIPVIMSINGELIDECKENGVAKINRSIPLSISHEITETTEIKLDVKGCGDANAKKMTIEVNGNCNEIEKVIHDIYYNSKVKGSLAKRVSAENALDGVACSEIQLVDNKYYIIVINKQCGVREYRAEFEDIQTGKKISTTLRKSQEQANVHLSSSDRESFSVFTLNHDDLKSKGLFDLRSDELNTEPKYNMRIFPTEAIKEGLDLKGYESKSQVVKFQKCN